MNNSSTTIDCHRLTDGAVLITYGANSYTCYLKEEVDKLVLPFETTSGSDGSAFEPSSSNHLNHHARRFVVNIGNKTIMFEKENDPTVLRSPSAGKLVNYIVEDGGRVAQGQPYVEIEVMKMIMTLTAQESGVFVIN